MGILGRAVAKIRSIQPRERRFWAIVKETMGDVPGHLALLPHSEIEERMSIYEKMVERGKETAALKYIIQPRKGREVLDEHLLAASRGEGLSTLLRILKIKEEDAKEMGDVIRERRIEKLRKKWNIPEWLARAIKEHKIDYVFVERGTRREIRPVHASKPEDIAGEAVVRDYLKWVALQGGAGDIIPKVEMGRYYEDTVKEKIAEAERNVRARAKRVLAQISPGLPDEEMAEQAIKMYEAIITNPVVALRVRAWSEERKYPPNIDKRKLKILELIREGMKRGILWKPPHWKI